MTKEERNQEALSRATGNGSARNYAAIILGFMEKGIDKDDITPRENVFTYAAWKALGRQVKKGEHGVKVMTWIPMELTDKKTDESGNQTSTKKTRIKPRRATVFHVSQTEAA